MRYCIAFFLYFITSLCRAEATVITSGLNHSELSKMLTGLLLVLCLILILSWFIKRFNVVQLSSSKGFELVATMMIGPKEKITLIKAGDRYLLIGIGSGSVTTLHDFGDQLPHGFTQEHKPSFAAVLKTVVWNSSS
jgi:flagellar protein FliO/FliZ